MTCTDPLGFQDYTDLLSRENTWTADQTMDTSFRWLFRDKGLFIHSPSDGNLTIDSDGGILLNPASTMTIGDGSAGIDYILKFDGETNDIVMTAMEDENELRISSHLRFGAGAAGVDYTLTIDGETNDFLATWMEDEDYLKLNDDLLMNSTEKIMFGNTTMFMHNTGSRMEITSPLGITLNSASGSVIFNPTAAVIIGNGSAGVDYFLKFDGETNDCILTWKEDEDYLESSDDILLQAAEKLFLRDTGLWINSPSDGNLTIDSDGGILLNPASTMTIGDGSAGIDYILKFDGETNDITLTAMEDENELRISSHLRFGAGAAGVDYTLTIDGETNDFLATWMEDEDYLKLNDDLFLNSTEKIFFGSTASFIHDATGGAGGVLIIDGGNFISQEANADHIWTIGSTEKMRLTSTSLDVVNLLRAGGVRIDADPGGVAGTVTLSNVTTATPPVGAATYFKVYSGTTAYFVLGMQA